MSPPLERVRPLARRAGYRETPAPCACHRPLLPARPPSRHQIPPPPRPTPARRLPVRPPRSAKQGRVRLPPPRPPPPSGEQGAVSPPPAVPRASDPAPPNAGGLRPPPSRPLATPRPPLTPPPRPSIAQARRVLNSGAELSRPLPEGFVGRTLKVGSGEKYQNPREGAADARARHTLETR